MKSRFAVPPEQLRRVWQPGDLGFSTTEEIPGLEGLVGQERAVEALQFGLGVQGPGYNIFVAGAAGTGKTSYTSALVRSYASARGVPADWVYVHNFERPDEPVALALPPGQGPVFAREMEELVGDARTAAGRALNSKEYTAQRERLVKEAQAKMAQVMEELQEQAKEKGFALTTGERGLLPVLMREGQPVTDDQFAAMTPEVRRAVTDQAHLVRKAIAEAERRSFTLEKRVQAEMRRLDTQVVQAAVEPVVSHMRERYRKMASVAAWLDQVEQELVAFTLPEPAARGNQLPQEPLPETRPQGGRRRRVDPVARFRVNEFVHQAAEQGAPVVVETNPTYANLFGKAEFVNLNEAVLDDAVMQIKAGAIHRANGGYLVLQAADLLRSPHAWEALKRALSTREARIEVPGLEQRLVPIEVVRPQPIPLEIKVILIGSTGLYRGLLAMDEGFRKQFKVKAEFDVVMEADAANLQGYACFVAQVCRRDGLRHFTAAAVAKVIEHSHRLADDQMKLSARFNEVVEVIYEADVWAGLDGSLLVDASHVQRAIREQWNRSALPEVRLQEMIRRGTILVDVDGAIAGQVNGLTVMSAGDYAFGSPSRITARAFLGGKGIVHIEREIQMSGQIHAKGVFTLSAFLGDRFAQERPLALSASIAFEQTYMPVDGDSASSTELYALLSALSDVPIDQGIAVTGSVNQRGEIQPIGGVNQKIEGFYRICEMGGLTGRQGVLIPRRNLPNLALTEEVVEAVRAGKFYVWAIDTIEEGIEILTGVAAGARRPDGSFTPGSLFERVDRRLAAMARTQAAWHRGGQEWEG